MSDERIPWAQELVERKVAAAIGKRLAGEQWLRKSRAAHDEQVSGTAFVTRPIPAPKPRPAPRAQQPGPEAQKPDRKSALIFLHAPGKAVYFDIEGTRHFGRILRDAPQQDGVYVATKESEAFVRTEDLHELTDAMMERIREQQDKDREHELEEQGARLARFTWDDIRPGWAIQVEGMYGTSQRGRVVYLSQTAHQFGVLRVFGTGGPVEPVYCAFTPGQIQMIQDEHGGLPPRA